MTLVFSLLGGLSIAVVVQLVFANLGIALGLTLLDFSPRHALSSSAQVKTDEAKGDETENDELEADQTDFSLPVTHLLGLSVAIGLSLIIFIGTLLSVEFSGLLEPRRGIIFGLVFWSTYWLLFIWLCSTTVSGIADSLIGGAIASGKRLITTVKQSVSDSNVPSGSSSAISIEKTIEEKTIEQQAAIRELAAEVSRLASAQSEVPELLANQNDTLLSQLNAVIEERLDEEKSSQTTPSGQGKTEITVTETERASVPDVSVSTSSPSMLSQLDLPSWQQIAKSMINQVDLSDWDVETLLEQISTDGQDGANNQPRAKAIASQMMGSVIALLPDAISYSDSSEPPSENHADRSKNSFVEASVDTSISTSTSSNIANRAATDYSATIQTIQTKLEDYCRYTNVSSLSSKKLSDKVQSQLQEYDLSTEDIRDSQRSLDIESIEAVLSRRQKLSSQKKQQLIETLEQVWPSVSLAPKPTTKPIEDIPDLDENLDKDSDDLSDLSVRSIAEKAYQTVDKHLQTIDWDAVSLEDIKPEVNTLLSQLEREGSLSSIDWQALVSRVQIHHGMREEFTDWLKSTLTDQLRSARPVVIHTAKDLSQHFSERITDYLKNREKPDLHPEKAARELSQIVGGAIAALPHPAKLSDLTVSDISFDQVLWDKDQWQQTLESRKDMSAEEIQQIIEWGEQAWQPKAEQIGGWLQAVQAELSKYLSLSDLSLPDLGLPDLNLPDKDALVTAGQQINEQITTVQEAVSEQITSVKEDIQAQVTAVKEDIQEQVDSGRRQIAIAAWWLFIAFIWSGSAAAGAGWLATIY